jgi:transglycosylase-like protein
MTTRQRRVLLVVGALALLGAASTILAPATMVQVARSRAQHAASERGLSLSWRRAHARFPARITFRDLVVADPTGGDTLLAADSVAVALDPWGALLGRARVVEIGAAHARVRLRHRPDDADTLDPGPARAPDRRADPARAERVRRTARQLVRLLGSPARELPRLGLHDVTVRGSEQSLWQGARLSWLRLDRLGAGIRLAGAGALVGEREIQFATELRYGGNDRLQASARFRFPGTVPGRPESLDFEVDARVVQQRARHTVEVVSPSHVTIGEIPLQLEASLAEQGPRARLAVRATGLTESIVKRSLPATVLGPLEDLGVLGSWDYRLDFDLDFARPDSVRLTSAVTPHGLRLDPRRTRLRLTGLDQPFTAVIRLPRDRSVTRELSPGNPNYRALEALAPALVNAVVTNEDGAYFRHRGFNLDAVREAIAENLRAGAFRRGAGTITMQVARNLYLGHRRTLSRKFQEVVLAWVLENLTWVGKARLLEIYLNVIEWGPGVHGAAEAARFYFDRDPAWLSVPEALFLATVIPAPARWRGRFGAADSLRYFARAQMHFIGRAMIAKGWLAADELPPLDQLHVVLRGRARELAFPDSLMLVRSGRHPPVPPPGGADDSEKVRESLAAMPIE